MSRWGKFRSFWFGLCGGTLIGILVGVWIADKPGWKWFAGVACPLLVFIEMLPDLISQIARGVRRFRSVARR